MGAEGAGEELAEFHEFLHRSTQRLIFILICAIISIIIVTLNHVYNIFSDTVELLVLSFDAGSFAYVIWDRVKVYRYKKKLGTG